jgi:hypothetical protein
MLLRFMLRLVKHASRYMPNLLPSPPMWILHLTGVSCGFPLPQRWS